MKIYAEDFVDVGFYISHKNEALAELAEYNLANFERRQPLCTGLVKRKTVKPSHPQESHEKLPAQIRGKHFNDFRALCGCLGCYLQQGKTEDV